MQKNLHFKYLFTFELLDYLLLILNVLLGVFSIVPYGKLEIFSEHVCIVKIKIIAAEKICIDVLLHVHY